MPERRFFSDPNNAVITPKALIFFDIHTLRSITLILCALVILASCDSTNSDTPQYSLTLSAMPTEGGSVSLADSVYDAGSGAELSATPSEGWRFDHWEGD